MNKICNKIWLRPKLTTNFSGYYGIANEQNLSSLIIPLSSANEKRLNQDNIICELPNDIDVDIFKLLLKKNKKSISAVGGFIFTINPNNIKTELLDNVCKELSSLNEIKENIFIELSFQNILKQKGLILNIIGFANNLENIRGIILNSTDLNNINMNTLMDFKKLANDCFLTANKPIILNCNQTVSAKLISFLTDRGFNIVILDQNGINKILQN